jgi:hypothetical protein
MKIIQAPVLRRDTGECSKEARQESTLIIQLKHCGLDHGGGGGGKEGLNSESTTR